jgi:hypothetical protein
MAGARTKGRIVLRAEEGSFDAVAGLGPPTSGPIYAVLDCTTGVGSEERGERGRRIPRGIPC